MLQLIKKLLNVSLNQSGESFLQILQTGDKKITFVIHMNSQVESDQLLFALIELKHTKSCQIVAYHSKDKSTDIVIEVCFFSKKKNTQEVYKLILDILNKEQEIKENGKNNRET